MTTTGNLGRSWSHWFEIATTDFDRARKFYEEVFEVKIEVNDFGQFKMGIFPHTETGGAICWGAWYKPSPHGTVVYLDANPDLTPYLERVAKAGGKIIQDKKLISPEIGYMALFSDSEGNTMALHSMK